MTDLHTDTDHANVIAPAPLFYGAALITGQIIDYFISIPLLSNSVALALGITVIAISIPIVLLAIFELRKAGTAFDARKPSTKLVTSGIYQYSRNSTYLSLTLLFIGIAFAVNSLATLILVVVAVVIVQIGVVRREEIYMATKFGAAYDQYKLKVRQWI